MGGAESVVRNVDKRTSRREHRTTFEAAIARFRVAPFTPQSGKASAATPRTLRVCVRKRPFFDHERKQGEFDVLSALSSRIVVHDARMHPDMRNMFINHHDFAFDEVFDETVDDDAVYVGTTCDLVQNAIRGGRGTVMMYGQTGSGKTFTMSGLYERAAQDIFASVGSRTVSVSFVELLGDSCFDMLKGGAPCSLVTAASGAVHPFPCVEVPVADATELLTLVRMAGKLRATAATGVHDQSSRSHALCRIFIQGTDGEAFQNEGCLTLVDLAGTEHRIDNAEHNAERQREGAKINASLAALKDCIRATAAGAKFVAFRQNRLTQLLRDCFMNAELHPTVVVATVSPSSKDTEHSLNTLRHACIMDGQGEGKAKQSAHLTGGAVTKESLGEIDVTAIAREKAAAKRSAKSPRFSDRGGIGELKRPPPTHQAKQSNTAKRSVLDRKCVQGLPPALAEKLKLARGTLRSGRQRARLGYDESAGDAENDAENGSERNSDCEDAEHSAGIGEDTMQPFLSGHEESSGKLPLDSSYEEPQRRDLILSPRLGVAEEPPQSMQCILSPLETSLETSVNEGIHVEQSQLPEDSNNVDTSPVNSQQEGYADADHTEAMDLFNLFQNHGRSAKSWTMIDMRLINAHVVPRLFGNYARIDWTRPDVALDELEILLASKTPNARASTRTPHRPRGRQTSQGLATDRAVVSKTESMPNALADDRISKTQSLPNSYAPAPRARPAQPSLRRNTQPKPQRSRSDEEELRILDLSQQAATAEADVRNWIAELREAMHRDDSSHVDRRR